jgi:hypothetical protein
MGPTYLHVDTPEENDENIGESKSIADMKNIVCIFFLLFVSLGLLLSLIRVVNR